MFQVGSQTFRQGERIRVFYTDENNNLGVEIGYLETITEFEIVLRGIPPQKIALDQVKYVERAIRSISQNEEGVPFAITPAKGFILVGLCIAALYVLLVIRPPKIDFIDQKPNSGLQSGIHLDKLDWWSNISSRPIQGK